MNFDRFTDRAKKVMLLANMEARKLNYDYVGVEHLLLGLAQEGAGLAAYVLKESNKDYKTLRETLKKLSEDNPEKITIGHLPFTPRLENCVQSAEKEAKSLNHNFIGTEHLLMGLLSDNEGLHNEMLKPVKSEDLRKDLLRLLGQTDTIYVVLRFENLYDQHGGYFVGIFNNEPTSPNGHFGRQDVEETWYEIHEITTERLYHEDDSLHSGQQKMKENQ